MWGAHIKSGLKSLIEELKSASYSLRKLHVPDLEFYESSRKKEDGLKSLIEEYINYKQSFVKHLHFDPEAENLSELRFCWKRNNFLLLPVKMIEHAPLEAVYIYFGTATYDEIERDVKVRIKNFVTDTMREKLKFHWDNTLKIYEW